MAVGYGTGFLWRLLDDRGGLGWRLAVGAVDGGILFYLVRGGGRGEGGWRVEGNKE